MKGPVLRCAGPNIVEVDALEGTWRLKKVKENRKMEVARIITLGRFLTIKSRSKL